MNYKHLTQKNRKYFIIVKEIAITEERERIKKFRTRFLEQLFKCVKIIFPQIYLKTDRRTRPSVESRYRSVS